MSQAASKRTLLYVGTYSRPAGHVKGSIAQGIYTLEVDESGKLTPLAVTPHPDNPSFLTITADQRHLYAVSEIGEGAVTAYSIDPADGALTRINSESTHGDSAAYVALDRTDRFVLTSNYGGGGQSAVIYPIRADGGVAPASSSVKHSGSGFDKSRQDGPHAHSIQADLTNRFVYVADLGIDKLMVYRLDAEKGRLVENGIPGVTFPPETGIRHFAFHPNGQYVYVIGELNSTLTVLSMNAETGELHPLQTFSTLPEGVDPASSYSSEVAVHPSGRFVFGGNRGHDSIVTFAVDAGSGRLSLVGHQSTQGKVPRHFAVDPTGVFLLAANQDSDTIVTFRIDQETGALEPLGHTISIPSPVCLKMITV